MGSILKPPKPPGESQQSKDAKAAEKERLAQEQLAIDTAAKERQRKRRANLIGSGSLQDDEMGGYGGYLRKTMGGN